MLEVAIAAFNAALESPAGEGEVAVS